MDSNINRNTIYFNSLRLRIGKKLLKIGSVSLLDHSIVEENTSAWDNQSNDNALDAIWRSWIQNKDDNRVYITRYLYNNGNHFDYK